MSANVNASAKVAANVPRAAQCERDFEMQNSLFHTDECKVSSPDGLDNVVAMQEVSENGSNDLPSPTLSPTVSSVSPNTGDVRGSCGAVVEHPIFDLNEVLVTEEGVQEHITVPIVRTSSPSAPVTESTGLTGNSSSWPAPIVVVAATKGSFIPPI
ncbi:hypothetical protein KP509_29G076700 [Ceratopteris richardii]|nr:hypothetical protein KP509_29G076700 [Ceratopteris richardii]